MWESRVTITESLEQYTLGEATAEFASDDRAVDLSQPLTGAKLDFGYINVNRQPKLYKKIRERTLENIGYGPITLDPFIYDTAGFALYPPVAWRETLEANDKRHI